MARHRSLLRRLTGILATTLGLYAGTAAAAFAQTQDDFFKADALHELRIDMSRRDWQALRDHFDEDTYYAADLRWNGITVRNVGIRSRGHVTRNPLKPGLRIDVNRYVSERTFLGLTAFTLDNSFADASVLREQLAMAFFTRMEIAAPREAPTRLFVNDDYAGAYVIVEAIDRAFIERTFGADEAQVERGGFLFEYRWAGPYGFEYLGPDLEAYAARFTPETRETDSMYELFGRIEEMVRAINTAPDDEFAASVGKYLDIPHFIRYLAVENFLAEIDGVVGEWAMHNFYLFRRQEDHVMRVIPWDKDTSFFALHHPVDYHLLDNVLTRRAMAVPELRQIYTQTLIDCARLAQEREPEAADSRGWLEREIDRGADLIRSAVSDDPFHPFSLEQFDADVEGLREFARRRPAIVACALGTDVGDGQACGPTSAGRKAD